MRPDLFELGLAQRKATLGADYVERNLAAADDFTRPFQEAMTAWCWGFGWGATEGSVNPVIATLYPDDKTGKLNSLHAWWPFGLILGGLISVVLFKEFAFDWRVAVALPMLPGALLAVAAARLTFPQTESAAQGVSFNEMLAEPFKRPFFWVFFGIMFLTASTEPL